MNLVFSFIIFFLHCVFFCFRLVDTFEKKSRESSVEPSSDTTADHGYHQARKLSEAAASGLEQEEEEVDEERERAPEAEQSSDEDDFV